jgi:hypothetical protein
MMPELDKKKWRAAWKNPKHSGAILPLRKANAKVL